MVNKIEEFNKIYPRIKQDLDKLQEEIKKETKKLKQDMTEQFTKKIFLSVNDFSPREKESIESLDKEILDNKKIYDASSAFLKVCMEQKEIMRLIYSFNPLFQNSTAFIELIDLLKYPEYKEYQKLKGYGSKFGIKYRVLSSDMEKVDKLLIPCKHNFCSFCTKKLENDSKCPICRGKILTII